jgi:hypothetical protein
MSKLRWRAAGAGALGIAAVAGIVACGDNASKPAPPAPNVVVRVDPASAAECPFGGSVVKSGVDGNGNGVLDDAEIANQTPLCNAPPVQPAPPIVIRLVAEPAGAHCALDGTAVESGPDTNGNGVLDDAEVTHVDYVCGEPLLTRIVVEPAGAACVAGGVAFQVGRDRDHDGVLGDAEVEQTEVECGDELARDVVIASPADAAALVQITQIGGSLTVDAGGLDTLALPALVVVRGDLAIHDQAALAHVAMPVLQSIGGRLALTADAQLADVALPRLSHVGGLVIDGDPALPDLGGLAALASVTGDVAITHNAGLTAAVLPAFHGGGATSVTIDDNGQLDQLALALTTRIGAIHVGGNPVLTRLAIAPTPGDFVDADRVVIDGNAQLAAVALDVDSATGIAIDDNPALADVGITTFIVDGELAMRGNGPLSLTLNASEVTGALTLSGPLTAVHSPSALSVAGDCTLDATQLVRLDVKHNFLPCGGGLHLTNNPQLAAPPVLSFGGSLELRGNPALTDLAFVPQDHVFGDVTITDNAALASVPATLIRIDGGLTLDHNASMTALDLPALLAIGGPVEIRGNAALTALRVPQLDRADMGVFDNPHLPACAVDAVFAGLRGDHQQSGNDDTAVCAP